MSDNISRHKSQRWVSASKATYDGADWEEYSSDSGNEDVAKPAPKLPELPAKDASASDNASSELTAVACMRSDSVNSSARSVNKSVNEDLDSLMQQISQEMTPKKDDEENHNSDVDEEENQELEVSKTGYFAAYVADEGTDEQQSIREQDEVSSKPENDTEFQKLEDNKTSETESVLSSEQSPSVTVNPDDEKDSMVEGSKPAVVEEDSIGSHAETHDDGDDIVLNNNDSQSRVSNSSKTSSISKISINQKGNEKESESNDSDSLFNGYGSEENSVKESEPSFALRKTSKTDLPYQDTYSSDESEIYTGNSNTDATRVKHGTDSTESFKFRDRVRDSILDSSDDDMADSDNDHDLEISEGGYFAKMVNDDQGSRSSAPETLNSNDAVEDSQESDDNSITESITKSVSRLSLPRTVDSKDSNGDGDDGFLEQIDSSDEDVELEKAKFSTRESINLGKWKPDTDAFRSGFVTETMDPENLPEGYIVDKDGNIVDNSTGPVSGIKRNGTTSSDTESQFNAFPHEAGSGDEDIQTIADTKTIYDNQTIYNVPAVIANNVSAPALPTNIEISDNSAEFVSSNDTILKHVTGQPPHIDSKLRETYSLDSETRTSVVNKNPLPTLNMVKLLESNEQHSTKLQKLNSHQEELKSFDTGLQGWISYALRSSTASDRDFIFKDYKVNKHVQDAYAQADSLSKKNSVANTVNQNVTHLKKKMFSSSMREKSKGLFSSIGKKL